MSIQRTLAAIGVWMVLGAGPLAAQRFTLSGSVVDGAGNQPLAGVAVTLQTDTWEPTGEPVVTDAQGRFAFRGLSKGEYILSAEGSGFGTVTYGAASDPGWVSTIHVTADKSVIFPIVASGSIEGLVRDEFGDPMMGAGVSIERSLWRNGKPTVTNVGQRYTDDRGRYHFGKLAPGSYMVCIAGGQNVVAPVTGPVDFAARGPSRAYTRSCERAFQLGSGQRARVDLSPQIGLNATVSGHLRNVPLQMTMMLVLAPDDGNGNQSYNGVVDPQGAFAIHNVAPGRYRLVGAVSHDGKTLSLDAPVDVAGGDVSGLDVELGAGSTVDLAIGGLEENHIDPGKVMVYLQYVNSATVTPVAERGQDGVFHFKNLAARRYRLAISLPPESCLVSLKLGDREIRGEPFEIGGDAALHLDATVTKGCGAIEARVVRGGEAAPFAKVVLLLNGTPKDPGEIKEDFANDEGGYSFTGLTPGRYLVWAWPVSGPGAIAGPASLAAVEGQATVVEVKAGERQPVDVPVLPAEGQGQ